MQGGGGGLAAMAGQFLGGGGGGEGEKGQVQRVRAAALTVVQIVAQMLCASVCSTAQACPAELPLPCQPSPAQSSKRVHRCLLVAQGGMGGLGAMAGQFLGGGSGGEDEKAGSGGMGGALMGMATDYM